MWDYMIAYDSYRVKTCSRPLKSTGMHIMAEAEALILLGSYSQDVFEKHENKGCIQAYCLWISFDKLSDICEIFGFWTISGHL